MDHHTRSKSKDKSAEERGDSKGETGPTTDLQTLLLHLKAMQEKQEKARAEDKAETLTQINHLQTNLVTQIQTMREEDKAEARTIREEDNTKLLTQIQTMQEKAREEDKAEAQTRNDLLQADIHNIHTNLLTLQDKQDKAREDQTNSNKQIEKLQANIQALREDNQTHLHTVQTEIQRFRDNIQEEVLQIKSQTEGYNTATTEKINAVEKEIQQIQDDTEQEFRQVKTDIKYTQHRVMENEKKIENAENKVKSVEEKIDNVEKKVKEDFETLKTKQFEQMRRDLEHLKGQGNRMSYVDGNGQHNPLLKLEHWPKYKGISDPLHPITFLRSIIRITRDISENQRLNLIRLTLKESALEWFEMIEEKCQNIEDFQNEFMKQFWNKNHQDKLKVRLLTGKYREGVISRELYACNLYNKCKHIDNFTEEDITRQLTTHFIYTDTQTIFCQDMKTMEELLGVLRRLDDITDLGINRQTTYTPRYPNNYQRTRTPPPYNRFNNFNNNRYNNTQNYRNQGQSSGNYNNNFNNNRSNNQQYNNQNNRGSYGNNNQNYRSNNGNRNNAQLNNIYGRSRPRRGNFNGRRSPTRRSRSYEEEGTKYEDTGVTRNRPAEEKKTPISSEQERYCQPSTSSQNM